MPGRQLLLLTCLGLLAGCDQAPETPTVPAASEALEELQRKYDELVGDTLEKPMDWAAEDFENIGDWDYKVVDIEFDTNAELEEQLNSLGDDKWQVIWMTPMRGGLTVVLKRPSLSYMSKIPLSQLGRLIPMGDGQ